MVVKLWFNLMDEINLTKNLISIKSINPGGNEIEVFNFLKKILKKYNFRYKEYILEKKHPNLFIDFSKTKNKNTVLFIGHLDTVPFGKKKWKYDPLNPVIFNNKLYGRGSTDMKGGIATFLSAAISLKNNNFKNANLKGIFVSKEETACEGSIFISKYLKYENVIAVVVPEPTDNIPLIGHKGVIWLKLIIEGKTAHGSSPELGDNAIYKSLEIIKKIKKIKFNDKHKYLGTPTINIGMIKSGQNINSVPDLAEIFVDIRTVGPNKKYLTKIKKYLKNNCKFQVIANQEFVYNEKWKNKKNLKFLKDISNDAGFKFKPLTAKYFTDGAPIQKIYKKPFTIILGPGTTKLAHQTNENVKISALKKSKEMFRKIIKSYCL